MNRQALENLLSGTRQNIAQAKADLAGMTVTEGDCDAFYHQGYQNGRVAELDSLANIVETALAIGAATPDVEVQDQAVPQRVRIARAINGLRYGALVKAAGALGAGRKMTEAEWLEQVADWLDEYSAVIARYADQAQKAQADLEGLQRDVRAVRRVLGASYVVEDTRARRQLDHERNGGEPSREV